MQEVWSSKCEEDMFKQPLATTIEKNTPEPAKVLKTLLKIYKGATIYFILLLLLLLFYFTLYIFFFLKRRQDRHSRARHSHGGSGATPRECAHVGPCVPSDRKRPVSDHVKRKWIP